MSEPDLPEQINNAASRAITSAVERLLPRVDAEIDHCHATFVVNQRFTDEGQLIAHGIEIGVSVCTKDVCMEPDDGGISEWLQLPQRARITDDCGRHARSEEEMASAAIRNMLPRCIVEKNPEGEGLTDLSVTLPNGIKAAVEVTMHTDGANGQFKSRFSILLEATFEMIGPYFSWTAEAKAGTAMIATWTSGGCLRFLWTLCGQLKSTNPT